VKRINLKVLLTLVIVTVVGLVGLFFLRRFQVTRNAGNIAKLARQRLEEGKSAEALQLFSRYIGLRPEDSTAYAEFAKLLLARTRDSAVTRSDIARAYNALETAVRRNPENDALRRDLAEFQIRIGRVTDAREHLGVLRERIGTGAAAAAPPPATGTTADADAPPSAVDVDMLLVRSHLAAADFDAAGQLAAQLVGFDVQTKEFAADAPAVDRAEAYVVLAAILKEKADDAAAANRVLEQLVAKRGDDVTAWLAMANWHRQQGNNAAAAKDVARALEIDATNVDATFMAFELALGERAFDRAQAIAEQARVDHPTEERVYRGLASIALQRGDPAAAETVLLEGVEMLPTRASLLLMLADALLLQNKLDEVEQAISRIRELYGSASPAVGLLEARLLVARRSWNEAKQKLEQVRPLVAGTPELARQVDLYLSQCHAQLDEYDAQLDVSRRILADDPTSLGARAGAASALVAAGKTAEALAEFEAIAAALPPDRLATVPQVWYPLLQLRLVEQSRRPTDARDWSAVDALLETLQQSDSISATQLTLLRAEVLMRKGEQAAARDLLEQGVTADPADVQLWAALATLDLRERGAEAARAVLARVPAASRDASNLMGVELQIAAGEKGPEANERLADLEKRSLALEPETAATMLAMLAGAQLARGDSAAAERLWRAVAERRPSDLRAREALYELAVAAADVPRTRDAAAEIVKVAGPTAARSRVAEAGVLILEARESLRKRGAAGDDARGPNAAERELLDEARTLLSEAENDRPGWSTIQAALSEIDGLRGDLPGAIARLKKAVASGTASPALVRRLVALLYSTNRLEEAQEALESLGGDGEQGIDRISAELEVRAGKFEEAVALAEKNVSADSTDPSDLLWLGQLLDRSGKQERAGEVLARAAELAPERPDVWLGLFSHHVAAGRRGPAETALQRAAEKMPEPRRQMALAQGYEMIGRLDEAERFLREAIAVAPDDPEANRGLAAFLARTGQTTAARDLLEKAIVTKDASPAAVAARSWARRTLAEMLAERGTFKDLERALQLIDENADSEGELSPEDVALQVAILANRPDPASWRRAIELLERSRRQQQLNVAQRITLAQLLEKVGRWDECRDELVAVVAAPKTPPAYVAMLIEKMIDHGELSSARTWLKRLQTTTRDSAITMALEAKLAITEKDRTAAADAARKLMPGGVVPGDQPGQLSAVAKLMEDLGFPKAADKVLERYAGLASEGVIARAAFLGRQQRVAEALDLLESARDSVSLERLLGTALEIVRVQVEPAEAAARVRPWVEKARRVDPGSIVIEMLEAELCTIEGKQPETERIYRAILARPDLQPMQMGMISNNLAFHLAKPDTAAEARRLIDAAISELGPLPDLLDTRGLVRLAQGENAEAVADLQEAALDASGVKLLHLAFAQLRAGDEAAARLSLEAGRRRGLSADRLSAEDRSRLDQLETALQSAADTDASSPRG